MEQDKLTEKHTSRVYKETTRPKKVKRKNKSDLGENFVAPDGGWGWVICVAAGINNFSVLPCIQQFGLIFRDRLFSLEFTSSQITSIFNIIMAMSSLTGLTNGAVFRRFTFRQVGICGGFLVFFGIISGAFCVTFLQFVIFYSILSGIGLGISMSSMSLAVNTYFKKNRRRATGFSWTITGLGPIIFPHIITFSLMNYGVQWTILIFAAISLNSVVCALALQPVLRHVRKPKEEQNFSTELGANVSTGNSATVFEVDYECKYCQMQKRRKRSVFSSQYLFNSDDADKPGYEVASPGPPMLSQANDGWYGSRLSLASDRGGGTGGAGGSRYRNKMLRSLNRADVETGSTGALNRPNYFNREKEDLDRYASKASVSSINDCKCTCAEEKALLQQEKADELAQSQQDAAVEIELTIRQKIALFFDLDLLTDFTFVNLVLGITIITFGEMNFSILTPLILTDFGFSDQQISIAMSIIAGVDIGIRFVAPIILAKVKLSNQALFAVGILAIVVGRFLVAIVRSFDILLGVFLLIGFGKGFRTIFLALIIPSYVPLKRLPAASGLQLISTGLFTLAGGPFVGMITDKAGYAVTIHVINILTLLALFSWLVESAGRRIFYNKNTDSTEESH